MVDKYTLALSYFSFKKSDLISFMDIFCSAQALLECSHYDMVNRYQLKERTADKIIAKRELFIERAERDIELLNDYQIRALTYGSRDYPTLLAECCDAPLVLYVMGRCDFTACNSKWFSITGTKSMSDCGMLTTSKLIEDIAAYDSEITTVSGLSDGVEKLVHRASMRLRLNSVAVIPYALDSIPTETLRMIIADIVKSGGTIVSEYPLGSNFFAGNHKECHRIIAGLSHATIVTEAPLDSNTLNTVNLADSYSREVFAYPGRAIDVSYAGCNATIKSGKAEMITSFSDIAISMELESKRFIESTPATRPEGDMGKIYDVLSDGVAHSDEEIMLSSGLNAQQFNSLISMMELDDMVVALRGRMYIKKL